MFEAYDCDSCEKMVCSKECPHYSKTPPEDRLEGRPESLSESDEYLWRETHNER